MAQPVGTDSSSNAVKKDPISYAYIMVNPNPRPGVLGISTDGDLYVFWVKISDCSESFWKSSRQTQYSSFNLPGSYDAKGIRYEGQVPQGKKLHKYLEAKVFDDDYLHKNAWDARQTEYYAIYTDTRDKAKQLQEQLHNLLDECGPLAEKDLDLDQAVEAIRGVIHNPALVCEKTSLPETKYHYTHFRILIHPSVHPNAANSGICYSADKDENRFEYHVKVDISDSESAQELAANNKARNPDFYYAGFDLETEQRKLDLDSHWLNNIYPPKKRGEWRKLVLTDEMANQFKTGAYTCLENLKKIHKTTEDSTDGKQLLEEFAKLVKDCEEGSESD